MFVGLLTSSSCWWYSFNGASIPPEVETYTVKRFEDNILVNPNLSQELTQALIEKLASETNLSPVSQDGDVVFSGVITGYNVRSVASSGGDIAAQDELRITVNVNFENQVLDDQNWEQSFNALSNFDRNVNFNSVETTLVEEINEQLVNDIFNRAFVNW